METKREDKMKSIKEKTKEIKVKGWIAKDRTIPRVCSQAFFKKQPGIYVCSLGQFWSGTSTELVSLPKLKKGECKKVEIIIREVK